MLSQGMWDEGLVWFRVSEDLVCGLLAPLLWGPVVRQNTMESMEKNKATHLRLTRRQRRKGLLYNKALKPSVDG